MQSLSIHSVPSLSGSQRQTEYVFLEIKAHYAKSRRGVFTRLELSRVLSLCIVGIGKFNQFIFLIVIIVYVVHQIQEIIKEKCKYRASLVENM